MAATKLEDMTFQELTEYAATRIHLGLIGDGGKGMSREVHLWMDQAIRWYQFQQDKEKKKRKKKS